MKKLTLIMIIFCLTTTAQARKHIVGEYDGVYKTSYITGSIVIREHPNKKLVMFYDASVSFGVNKTWLVAFATPQPSVSPTDMNFKVETNPLVKNSDGYDQDFASILDLGTGRQEAVFTGVMTFKLDPVSKKFNKFTYYPNTCNHQNWWVTPCDSIFDAERLF